MLRAQTNRIVRPGNHASGTADEAKTEIGVWFTEEELHNYEHVLQKALYDPAAFLPV